jgi:alkyl hydroperoxide reductase subunit AhpC
MALELWDVAPNFEARTTLGALSFYDWIGDSWAVLIWHPRAFMPVSTTELGYLATIEAEFDRRGVKVVALSVGRASEHERWAREIEAIEGCAPHFPIVSDDDYGVAELYGFLPAGVTSNPDANSAADDENIRGLLVIGPSKKIELILVYPITTGHNFDELLRAIDSLQLTARRRVASPSPRRELETDPPTDPAPPVRKQWPHRAG